MQGPAMSIDQSSNNPYSTPNVSAASQSNWSPDGGMNYMQSIRFVWDNPNWLVNILIAAACLILGGFIPVVPGLVLMGYQCEMLEALASRPRDPYPDFKMDRILEYLVRGLWPFIMALIGALVILPVILVVLAVPAGVMALLISATGEDGAGIVVAVMVPLMIILVIVTAVACNVALVPFLLRAALTQDITASMDFQFAKDFVRRMWKETLLAGLFMVGAALAAELIGLVLFCVGVLFTIPFIHFAQVHLGMQLYQLYLARGGEKIPLKTAATPVGI